MIDDRDVNRRHMDGDLSHPDLGMAPMQADGSPAPVPPLIGTLAEDALLRAEHRREGREVPVPVPWRAYGRLVGGGYWPGMHVLVAGTGLGKTTFCSQIAVHAAMFGCPVAYVGLELDEMQIGLRMAANENWSTLYLGKHDPEGALVQKATEMASRMKQWPFFAVMGDPTSWPASRLDPLARFLHSEAISRANGSTAKPSLIILDFLQLVGAEAEDRRAELRERIGRAAYQARQVARRYNTAVLLISSTARERYAAMANGCPSAGLVQRHSSLGQLYGTITNPDAIIGVGKESGEIEYAADTVTVLTRYPNVNDMPVVLCCVPKVRYGRPGWVPFVFERQRFDAVKFEDLPERSTEKAEKMSPSESPSSRCRQAKRISEPNWGEDL